MYSATIAQNRNLRRYKPKDRYRTPRGLFLELDAEFHFTLDVCADAENTQLPRFLSPRENGLWQSWQGETCWMNPPFSDLERWIRKAYDESRHQGTSVVCLVPVRSDLGWWHNWAMEAEIRFIRGRVTFEGMTSSAPFPMALLVFK